MKLNLLLLFLVSILLLGHGGGQTLIEAFLLFAGTAIPLQLLIYTVWKLEMMRPLRMIIVQVFTSIPLGVGFSLLVVLGAGLISALVFMVRGFVAPANSWVFVTLGFLTGIMNPILRHLTKRKRLCEQAAPRNR